MIQVGRCCRWYIRRCRAFTGREYVDSTLSVQAFRQRQLSTFGPFGPAELLAQIEKTVFQLH